MDSLTAPQLIVAGTGPAGLAAALALARIGARVILVGPVPPGDDQRTTALMRPALAVLERLGILGRLRGSAAPLRAMRIVDATGRLVRSPVVTFRAAEIGEESFGLNIPNRDLNAALQEAVAEARNVEWRRTVVEAWNVGSERVEARLADGTAIAGSLAVAADGRLSPARVAAGIETSTRPFPQSALVTSFEHGRDHGFVSTEFHTATGPFTQVPLPGRRSSLVWVVKPETAAELVELDAAALSRRIEDGMLSMLGRIAVDSPRQVYPLAATTPSRFAANRVLLVGEAAHVFPPIGAQGLNLGMRDIEELVRIVSSNQGDPGSPGALAAYDARRRPDILARATAVNLLNVSLLSDMLPAQIVRSAGLGVLGALSPLRAFFMREGLQPGSGLAALMSELGKGSSAKWRES